MTSQWIKYTLISIVVFAEMIVAQTSSRVESTNEYFTNKIAGGIPFGQLALFIGAIVLFVLLLAGINMFTKNKE